MLTCRCHRYLTHWNRRLAFALAILLVLELSYRAYRIWRASRQPVYVQVV